MKRNSQNDLQSPSPTKQTKQQCSSSRQDIDQVDLEAFQKDLNRVRAAAQQKEEHNYPEIKQLDQFSTVFEAVEYLRLLLKNSSLIFSRGAENPFPPIVWRHHLYALFTNHTKVDTELVSLCDSNTIRILNVATSTRNADIIILIDDFCKYYTGQKKNLLLELFFSKILRPYSKTKYTVTELNQAGFGEAAIDKLINLGLLTTTDATLSTRQLSFPGLGVFIRTLHQGRKSLLSQIRKCKYSQILQSDLVKRPIPKCTAGKDVLGLELHVYDIYGARLVQVERLAYDVMIRVAD